MKHCFFKKLISVALTVAAIFQFALPSELSLFALKAAADEQTVTVRAAETTELSLTPTNANDAKWFSSIKLKRTAFDRASKEMTLSLSAVLNDDYLEGDVADFLDGDCAEMESDAKAEALKGNTDLGLPTVSLTFDKDYFKFAKGCIGEANAADTGTSAENTPFARRTVIDNGTSYTLTFAFYPERVAEGYLSIRGECSFDVMLGEVYEELRAVSLKNGGNNFITLEFDPDKSVTITEPADYPIYSLTKTTPEISDGTTEDFSVKYEIVASVVSNKGDAEKYNLNGLYLKEILPDELQIKSAVIDSPNSYTADTNGYKITANTNTVKMTINAELTAAAYKAYAESGSINKLLTNTAQLCQIEGGNTTVLAEASCDTTIAQSRLTKNASQNAADPRYIDWRLAVNGRMSHCSGAYLIDRLDMSNNAYVGSMKISINGGAKTEYKDWLDLNAAEYADNADVQSFLALGGTGDLFAAIKGSSTHNEGETGIGHLSNMYSALNITNEIITFTYTYDEKTYQCFVLPLDALLGGNSHSETGAKLDIAYQTKLRADNYDEMIADGVPDVLGNDAKIVYDHFCRGNGVGTEEYDAAFDITKGMTISGAAFTKADNGGYDSNTHKINWDFTVNPYGIDAKDFYIVDAVPKASMQFVGTENLPIYLTSLEEDAVLPSGMSELAYISCANPPTVEKSGESYVVTAWGDFGNSLGYTIASDDSNYYFIAKIAESEDIALNSDYRMAFTVTTKVVDEGFLSDNKGSETIKNTAYGTGKLTAEGGAFTNVRYDTVYAKNVLLQKEALTRTADEKSYTYNYKDNTVQWETTANVDNVGIKSMLLTDALPTGARLLSVDKIVAVNAANAKTIILSEPIEITDQTSLAVGDYTIGIANSNRSGAKNYYANSYTFKKTNNFAADTTKYIITYTTVWDDADGFRTAEFADGEETLTNNVALTGTLDTDGNGTDTNVNATADASVNVALDRLKKTGVVDSANYRVTWTVIANADQMNNSVNQANKPIVLTDTIPSGDCGVADQEIDVFSDIIIEVGTMDETGKSFVSEKTLNAVNTANYKDCFSNCTATDFTFTLPADSDYVNKTIKITYYTDITDTATGFTPLNNIAYGNSEWQSGDATEAGSCDSFIVLSNTESAEGLKVPSICIKKYGDNAFGTAKALSGVKFEMTATVNVNGTLKEYKKTRTTNAHGLAIFSGVREGIEYTITEVEGANGLIGDANSATEYYTAANAQWTDPSKTVTTGNSVKVKFLSSGETASTGDGVIYFPFDAAKRRMSFTVNNMLNSAALSFKKLGTNSLEATKIPLKGVVFTLSGKDAENTAVTVNNTFTTDENGEFEIKNLPVGSYTLTETTPKNGYVKTGLPEYTIEVAKDGTAVVKCGNDTLLPNGGKYVLENSYFTKDVTVLVTDSLYSTKVADLPITGSATFVVTMTEAYDHSGNDTTSAKIVAAYNAKPENERTFTTDANGKISLTGMPMGKYELVETAPTNYAQPSEPFVITIDYNTTKITLSNTPDMSKDNVKLYKYYKNKSGEKIGIAGLKFVLTDFGATTDFSENNTITDGGSINGYLNPNKNAYWSEQKRTFTTNEKGIVNFGKLPVGIYKLTENDKDFKLSDESQSSFIYVKSANEISLVCLTAEAISGKSHNEIVNLVKASATAKPDANKIYVNITNGAVSETAAEGYDLILTLENVKRATNANVSFKKIDSTNKTAENQTIPVVGASFTLSGKSAEGRQIADYPDIDTEVLSGADGTFGFSDLPPSCAAGYELRETASTAEYVDSVPSAVVARIVVDAAGVVTVNITEKEGEHYLISNAEYRTAFSILKTDSANSSELIGGAKYGLNYTGGGLVEASYRFTPDENGYEFVATTGENGTATFENVPVGTYEMKELPSVSGSKAAGYKLDAKTYTVSVSKTGVTIADLTKSGGKFVLTDECAKADLDIDKYIINTDGNEQDVKGGIDFDVERIGDGFGALPTCAYNPTSGNIELRDIRVGTYKITESDADFKTNIFFVEAALDQTANNTVSVSAYKTDTNTASGNKTSLWNSAAGKYKLENVFKTNSFSVLKKDATKDGENDNKPLSGVTFTLTETASANGRSYAEADKIKYIFEATTDGDGVAAFSNIPVGTYTLKETGAADGYQIDSTEITVTVGDTIAFDGAAEANDRLTLTNDRYVLPSLTIDKTYTYKNEATKALSGGTAVYELKAIAITASGFTGTLPSYRGSTETLKSGKIVFADLYDGVYELREISADGLSVDSTVSTITVANGSAASFLYGTAEKSAVNGAYSFNNTVYTTDIVIDKTDLSGSPIITDDVSFTLTTVGGDDSFKTRYGTAFTATASTVDGTATLKDVPAGKYYIYETATDGNFVLDTEKYALEVSRDASGVFSFTVAANDKVSVSGGKLAWKNAEKVCDFEFFKCDEFGNYIDATFKITSTDKRGYSALSPLRPDGDRQPCIVSHFFGGNKLKITACAQKLDFLQIVLQFKQDFQL